MWRAMLAFLAGMLLIVSQSAAAASANEPAPRASIQPIRWVRTGGESNTLDIIRITPQGILMAHGRQLKTLQRRLTDKELAEVTELFQDWDKIAADYPTPPTAHGDSQYILRYGLKTIRVSSANRDTPRKLRKLIERLERLGQR